MSSENSSQEELNFEPPAAFADAHSAQSSVEEELLGYDGVVGVGIGYKESGGQQTSKPSLVVLVEQKKSTSQLSSKQVIPSEIDGITTDVVEVGELVAGDLLGLDTKVSDDVDSQFDELNLTDVDSDEEIALETHDYSLRNRMRPVRPGASVGHYKATAGTIGAGCYDIGAVPGIPRKYYILSNNHVLAMSNESRIGDPIIQPGRYDGGNPSRDTIGRLTRFIPIKFDGSNNYVDAAIATVSFHNLDRDIFWQGYPSAAYTPAKAGMLVKKTGRTTSATVGKIRVINATVKVNYGRSRPKIAVFKGQIVTTPMGAPGDSGSLLMDLKNRPVGLLFAGSSRSTIHNPIAWVQTLLKVRVWP